MRLIVKHFSELTPWELHELFRVRIAAFVVEQTCPYQEIDGADVHAYHLWLEDEDGIVAYARALPAGVTFPTPAIGRIVSVKRRQGYALRIVNEAVAVAKEKFGATKITIEAQVYARSLYEKAGFVQCSEEFLEDGIPHIQMELNL